MDDQYLRIDVGVMAPDVWLKDEDDQDILLSTCWRDRPAALVFVRHFG